MKISKIYKQYKIMPMLQEHMLRVTGVAAIICDHIDVDVDRDAVISTCLIHDIGNIIKFDLSLRPDSLEPEGLDYWQNVQNEFKEKYGEDEHEATHTIAQEIGVSKKVLDLISRIGFGKSEENFDAKDFEIKICAYADSRVAFDGIVSLEERHIGSRDRYEKNKRRKSVDEEFMHLYRFSEGMGKQIFEKCDIGPEFIQDGNVNEKLKKLQEYELVVNS